jgi:hypothetical protein
MTMHKKIGLSLGFPLILMASGCKSAGQNPGSPYANTPPPASGGLGSWIGNVLAFGETGGRDPYSSPGGPGDYYPAPTLFGSEGGPSGGGKK